MASLPAQSPSGEPLSSEPQTSGPQTSGPESHRRDMVIGLLVTTFFDIVLTILLFFVARHFGASDFVAYLVSSIGPLIGMAIGLARTRKVDGVAVIILIMIAISAAVTLIGSRDATMLLLKDSALTGGFGLAMLVSSLPLVPKPMTFFFGLKFATGGTPEGTAQWYDMWDRYPLFRRTQRVVSCVWGVAYVAEAALKAIFAFVLPYGAAFTINQIAPFAVMGVLLFWTIMYAKTQRRKGQERTAQADAVRGTA